MKQALLFAAGVLALSACSGVDQQTSDLPSSPEVFAAPPSSLSCEWKAAGTAAKNYFSLRADKQAASGYLSDAEKAAAGSQLRNDKLFEVFKLVESARTAGNVVAGAEAQGALLVFILVKDYPAGTPCGSFVVSHPDGNLQTVLQTALTTGAFAYRHTPDDAVGTVATEDGGAALYTADWSYWIGGYPGAPPLLPLASRGRSMVFGAKFDPNIPTGEQGVGTFSYRFGLIYDSWTDGPGPRDVGDDIAVVELCEPDPVPGQPLYNPATDRVFRIKSDGATKTVLQVSDITDFCLVPSNAPGNMLSRALRGIVGFFAPTPLQARRRAPPGMSGSIDDLSDFSGVDPLSVGMTFTTQPVSGPWSQPFPVVIHVATGGGNDWEDVPVTLSVANNQGTPAGAELIASLSCTGFAADSSLTQNSNEDGLASFCVRVDKAGGYIIEANHGLGGFAAAPVLSVLFNRTGN
jgi:hypothetical protein